jgi:hypothetical protein
MGRMWTKALVVTAGLYSAAAALAQSPGGAYVQAGFDVVVADDDVLGFQQLGEAEIEAVDLDDSGRVHALIATKKPVRKVQFTIEKRDGTKFLSATPAGFHCGLVYRGQAMIAAVADLQPQDRALTETNDAAKYVAEVLHEVVEASGGGVVIEAEGNKVTAYVSSVEGADAIEGVSFGGDSRRFKISVRMLSVDSCDVAFDKYALRPAGTGGPLQPPVDPNEPYAPGDAESIDDVKGS